MIVQLESVRETISVHVRDTCDREIAEAGLLQSRIHTYWIGHQTRGRKSIFNADIIIIMHHEEHYVQVYMAAFHITSIISMTLYICPSFMHS